MFHYLGKEPKQSDNGAKSTEDKGPSVAPIAAGVGVTTVAIGILAAFVVYRIRR